MKNFKKIASAIAALSLAACVAVPMSATVFTASAADTYKITINETNNGYGYAAYQIFKGTLSADKTTLGDVGWGDAVKSGESGFDTAIKAVFSDWGETEFTAANVAKKLTDDNKVAFAKAILAYLDDAAVVKDEDGSNGYELDVTSKGAGYYLVKNTKVSDESGAYTSYILQVLGETSMAPKSAKPTVDKQVFDDDDKDGSDKTVASTGGEGANPTAIDNGSGWGETADHAIGETFQFRLTANMPKNAEIDSYKKYTLKFNDKMAEGVTFEKINSVYIYIKDVADPIEITKYDAESNKNGYQTAFTGLKAETEGKEDYKGDGESAWTLTISDLVSWLTKDTKTHKLSDIESVVVEYDAHLNSDAVVVNSNVDEKAGAYNATEMKVNINDVELEYSNNPNKGNWDTVGEGTPDTETGKTPKDTVGVFTYEVDSTKYKDKEHADNVLNGATFKLYNAEGCADANEVKLIYDAKLEAYRPVKAGEISTVLTSGADGSAANTNAGKFNIVGLDAGTYYLKELSTIAGYNLLPTPITISIVGKHKENTVGSAASLDLVKTGDEGDSLSKYGDKDGLNGAIINEKGATLPSTGGIGTTLFYLGGGALVAVAGVMLITKKRMTKE